MSSDRSAYGVVTVVAVAAVAAAVLSLIATGGLSKTPVPKPSVVASEPSRLDVPFVATPEPVVDKMLELGEVGPDDFLIDLGSGDGRIPITAAKRFGTHGLGVDIDPQRIQEARASAEKEKVGDKVEFRRQNLFKTDIGKATVLTMYLLPRVNMELRPRILAELKPGTRVVSHAFDMGDWKPTQTVQVDGRTVHMWIVPERAQESERQQGMVQPPARQ